MTIGGTLVTKMDRGLRQGILTSGGKIVQDPHGTLYTPIGKQWNGSDDPLYRQKIERGLSATNAYSVTSNKRLFARAARLYMLSAQAIGFKEIEHRTFGQGGNTVTWDQLVITNNTNAAMAKLYMKLNREQVTYGGFELLAEFRDTIRMIKRPAESLAAYLNERASKLIALKTESKNRSDAILRSKGSKSTIRRRLNKEQSDLRRMVSASWLELQFGVKPLLGTLADMADTSLEIFPREGAVKILTASSTERVRKVTRTQTGFGNVSYVTNIIEDYEYKVELKARVRYAGQYDGMSPLELLKAKGGFTLTQLVPLAWELAPLSVFVDYFVNVGDILTACMTETKNVTSVDRYISRKLIRRQEITLAIPVWGIRDPNRSNDGLVLDYFKLYTREKYVMSIPPVMFTSPADSLSKQLNLLAFLDLAFFNNQVRK